MDGLLRGFGTRFWQCIRDHHPATHSLLNNQSEQLISLEYKDRYLFTPLSISVLAEVIKGLRDAVGVERWALRNFEIETTNCRTTGEYRPRNKVWADWSDTNMRDDVLRTLFEHHNVGIFFSTAETSSTGHGRLLSATFSSGKILTLRFDQGVSYWHASHGNRAHVTFIDFATSSSSQAGLLAKLNLLIEGGQFPTQLFVKVR